MTDSTHIHKTEIHVPQKSSYQFENVICSILTKTWWFLTCSGLFLTAFFSSSLIMKNSMLFPDQDQISQLFMYFF